MSGTRIVCAGLLLALLSLPAVAARRAISPFAAMAGSWSGGGILSSSDGTQERLRCRAAYDVSAAGTELGLNLRCASDS
jgi:hypothetical protein